MTSALFKPQRGTIDGHLFGNPRSGLPRTLFYRIEVPLEPFNFDGKIQRTALRTDFITFPVRDWRELPNREFCFPINPEEGYIDGSLYLGHAHNPADVTRIAFGDLKGDLLTATLDIRFDFTFEGGASELGRFDVTWPVELQCNLASLDALMKEADRTAARR